MVKRQGLLGVSALSWRDFERLIGAAFRRRGFALTGFGSDRAAGGVDLGLRKKGERYLVQCRHWRKPMLGLTDVQTLHGTIAAQGANGGFAVTGGQFTREAREFAHSRKIELIDGAALAIWLGDTCAGLHPDRTLAMQH